MVFRLSRLAETFPLMEHTCTLPSILTTEQHGNVSVQPLGLPAVTWRHGIVSGADAQKFLPLDPSLAPSDSPSLTFPLSHFSPLFFPFWQWANGCVGGTGVEWEGVNSYLPTWQQRISQQLASGDAFIISPIFPQR